MAIYRGAGGSGDAINDASSEALLTVQAKNAALAAQTAAEVARDAAQLAETNAETAETNAETAETNAETAATNAANSASAAATSATNAANSATAAETAETNAETAETNAETAETNAAASAALANDWATKTSGAVAGGEYSAKYHAQQASSSASAASTSASNAATSESNAASSASAAAASYDNFDDRYLGAKSSNPTVDNDGNALLTGALYYNTTAPEMRVWNGSSWTFIGSGAAAGVESFNTRTGAVTLTSSDVTTALTYTPLAPSAIGTTVQAYDADLTTLGAGGSSARSFLGLAIGTDVQAYDAQLADIAGLTPTDNNFIVGNGTNFVTESGSTARTSLGLGSIATQDASNVTITGGSVSGITDLAIADGGTGASDAATARTNLGLGSSDSPTFAGLTDSGNLTFTGTGNRITGDFSNATIANRVLFQNSVTNGNTVIGAIPNGTATSTAFVAYNSNDPSNASFMDIRAQQATDVRLTSGINGTGSYLPLTMYTGGSERLRIDTSGNVGIGTTTSAGKVRFYQTADATTLTLTSDQSGFLSSSQAVLNIVTTNGTSNPTASFAIASTYNGNTLFNVRNDGNVGIGTSNTVNSKLYVTNTNVANLIIGYNNTGTNYIDADNNIFRSSTSVERMRITSNGGVSFGSSGTAYGTSGQVLTSNGDAAPSWATAPGTPTTNTYDTGTAATWTKPSSANWVLIEMWGGGGSGGKGIANGPAGGGGGGAYNSLLVRFADLQGTVTYTVGAGGTGQTTSSTAGNTGGTSSVTLGTYGGGTDKTIYAYGGAGGAYSATGGKGGGGGGIYSAGNLSSGGSPLGGAETTTGCSLIISQSVYGGGGAGQGTTTGNDGIGSSSVYGGGGGGGGRDTTGSAAANAGGNSQYGGGGGGGAAHSVAGGNGGTSVYGGNGSAGAIDANNSSAGTAPAGGSGGTEGGNSGAGGGGRVRFTYW